VATKPVGANLEVWLAGYAGKGKTAAAMLIAREGKVLAQRGVAQLRFLMVAPHHGLSNAWTIKRATTSTTGS